MMQDEELLNELKAKAMGIGQDARWLINELIKRYQIRRLEVEVLRDRIAELEGGG